MANPSTETDKVEARSHSLERAKDKPMESAKEKSPSATASASVSVSASNTSAPTETTAISDEDSQVISVDLLLKQLVQRDIDEIRAISSADTVKFMF